MNRSVVTFHYTLRDAQGSLLDASDRDSPINYLEGSGQIIEGLEEQMRGLAAGVKRRIAVAAAKAYGVRDEAQVQRVSRAALPIEGELRPGDRFQAGEDRFAPVVMVVKIEGDDVWLDANHPLAGVDLVFDVEIVATRPATSEEISQLQAQSEHGHRGL